MTICPSSRNFLPLLIISIFLFNVGLPSARAEGESVYIHDLYPLGSIDPGTSVFFSTTITGFTDPTYAVSDSFSASGATVGTIDQIGIFSWTPGVYDAGRHTLTVTVTDPYGHTASASTNITVSSKVALITSLSPGDTIAVGRSVTFSIMTPGFTSPNYAVFDANGRTSVNSSLITSDGVFTWTPTLDDVGAHPITVVASDPQGHLAQARQTITVITPTVSLASVKPGSGAGVGSLVSFVAHGNMLTNPSYSVADTFSGASTIAATNISSAGLFTWKPTSADLGMHTLTVTASDAAGNAASATIEFIITNAPATSDTPATIPTLSPASAASVTGTSGEKYVFTTTLRVGSRGTAVTELQKRLISQGFLATEATGYFGTLTSAGVKKFQKSRGLEQVGFVGPGTRKALNAI